MIEIKNFTKKFNSKKVAVENLSLTINDGDIFGFIGHNGAGKTTTIRCVIGALDFEEGTILINNKDINKHPIDCKKDMAYIPDNPDLYDHLTGIQYLNFICDIYKVSANERTEQIKKYADMFEITANLGDIISSYSHGMKQKLAIVSALVHSPKILILDEPFVGLDPKASHTLKEIMKDFCANNGTIFFSTHVLDVVEKLCNKVAIIKDGKLLNSGTTSEVVGNSDLESVFMELIDHD